MEIRTIRTQAPKQKPMGELGFGKYFTDHMYMIEYREGKGWINECIRPYTGIMLDPATIVFHYAQTIFEGLKAYRGPNGEIRLFRPKDNFERLSMSAERLCMPGINVERTLNGLIELLKADNQWIPYAAGTSLYIRPTMIATDVSLSVHASKSYLFYIILSPVGAYYKNGLQPVRLAIEKEYTRSSIGGTGFTKFGGNYGASLKSSEEAAKTGCDQVLWLDSVKRKYIEEVGSMNIFFVLNGEVITPALNGTILGGITRQSAITLLKDNGYKVTERKIAIDEITEGALSGGLTEIFGTGTAAVVSPVGWIKNGEEETAINGGQMGEVSKFLYDTLTGIQYGRIEDKYGWTMVI